ncbi:MAG: hypothetical protein OEZ06_05330 [Myxococcales bacterium]|nr:hypothetical protein [Myxococcales bacterium]
MQRIIDTTLVALAFSLLGGCASSTTPVATAPVAAADCAGLQDVGQEVADLYAQGTVRHARPIYRTDFVARAIQPRYVAGASFDVPAPRSGSAAYLERALSCHAVSQIASVEHPNDPLRVAGVYDVDVKAVGPHMRISVIGDDRTAGDAIWKRTRALSSGEGQVQVQQIARTLLTDGRL